MAALVWAGSRRVPSRISKIWAHQELNSMGFGYPNPTPSGKLVIQGGKSANKFIFREFRIFRIFRQNFKLGYLSRFLF